MAGKLKPTGKKAKAGVPNRVEKRKANKELYAKVKAEEAKKREAFELSMLPKSPVAYTGQYTTELGLIICESIRDGLSLKKTCTGENMPPRSTVLLWLEQHEDFYELYTRARIISTEAMADDILEISDDASNDYVEDSYMNGRTPGYQVNSENINRSKLRVETRKYLMGKLQPKKYGDKIDLTTNGKDLPAQILGVLNTTEQPGFMDSDVMDDIGTLISE